MIQKTILVASKDAFIGSMLVDMVEKEQIGTICSYCSDGLSEFNNIKRLCPQFILLDLFLPGVNGISILREIKKQHKDTRILCFYRQLNKRLGVKSYPSEVQELLDENDYETCPQNHTEITTRQSQILEQVSLGKSNKEISGILDINLKTVEKHKRILKQKFGLYSMAEVVHFAIRNGIIEREEGKRGRNLPLGLQHL